VSRDIHEAIPDLIIDHVRQIRPRHYVSFSQASAENAASRVFLGIHWRFDQIEGVSAGNRIADIVYDNKLRPRIGRGPSHVPSVDFEAQIDAYLNNTYMDYFAPGGGGGQGGGGFAPPPGRGGSNGGTDIPLAPGAEDATGAIPDPVLGNGLALTEALSGGINLQFVDLPIDPIEDDPVVPPEDTGSSDTVAGNSSLSDSPDSGLENDQPEDQVLNSDRLFALKDLSSGLS
jgi:hypothetical protein